jgi:hypothetical protein
MLTNRDLASLIWIAVILIVSIAWPKTRPILRTLVGALLSRLFLILISLYLAWMILVVAAAYAVGLWGMDLLKDTVVWLVTVGLVLLFKINDATSPGFYRHRLRKVGLLGIVLGFYLNLAVLPLVGEIVLQPITAWVVFASSMGAHDPRYAAAKKIGDRLQTLIGLALLALVALWLASNWRTLDPASIGLSLLLPVWLTIGALPFVYVLSVVFNYDSALRRLDWMAEGHRAGWKAKLALALGFRLRLRELNSPGHNYAWGLARAKSLRDGLQVIGDHRRSLRQAEADKRQAEERLRDYAGVSGTDEDGRQLDQREFVETRRALRWIATCQMGWYRHPGAKYERDLLDILSTDTSLKGLPADHGIQLVVAKNRRSWYAWRRTIGGYCFAIGAAKAPPDQWLYDGPEPPTGFPGKDPIWGTAPFGPDAANW